MKSKRAKEFIRNSAFSAIQLPGEVMYSIHMNVEGKLLDRKSAERAVELAEQDAEEEVNHYRKELEESKRREELARNVIDDQRKKIEEVKARAVESFRESCPIKHPGLNDKGALCDKINIIGFGCNCPVSDCEFLLNFFQILNDL